MIETLHRYPIEVMCAPPTIYRSLYVVHLLPVLSLHSPCVSFPIALIGSNGLVLTSRFLQPPEYNRVTTSSLAYLKSHPPKALQHCVGAGEPLNASVIQTFAREMGIVIKDGYGQTETNIIVSLSLFLFFLGRLEY
jgi:acyl-CoA synthetase (AMP-forming)/AMP-acid ligase II